MVSVLRSLNLNSERPDPTPRTAKLRLQELVAGTDVEAPLDTHHHRTPCVLAIFPASHCHFPERYVLD
jgi:hypothetical protein